MLVIWSQFIPQSPHDLIRSRPVDFMGHGSIHTGHPSLWIPCRRSFEAENTVIILSKLHTVFVGRNAGILNQISLSFLYEDPEVKSPAEMDVPYNHGRHVGIELPAHHLRHDGRMKDKGP